MTTEPLLQVRELRTSFPVEGGRVAVVDEVSFEIARSSARIAALTLGLRGGGILLSLLILPLYIPVLVYGSGAVSVSMIELADTQPYFYLLGAFLLIALLFAPLASAAALRISTE